MLKKWYNSLCFLFIIISTIPLQAQDRQAKPLKGEGAYAFLIRHNLKPSKHLKNFYKLNTGKFSKNKNLLVNTLYTLPNSNDFITEPLFGKEHSKFRLQSNEMSNTVIYLISGHGGPDPGAIGKYGKYTLHEDEYAYDITLRLAKRLMENGAKVYLIIQDAKDGIRDENILKNSKRETCMGKKIPLNQVARLKQRADATNKLYKTKDTNVKYKRAIVLHVDSRSKSQQLDVFFYHHENSTKGKRLVTNIFNTFDSKYDKHQPNRGFTGTISSRNLYVIRETIPPVAFIELGNIQNKQDQIRFVSVNNRQALANWLYEGIKRDYKQE